ncbi:hypothetical protein Asera_39340 [Actinocatenispora sera]|uniref:Uncharacterized protein n=1 Tax=Actinocatenispora sera TaxID=390989 RepID=A0A810L627_9ACTN|nr:hypothetical protein Asera_39340 [Actinocatenispora sera]
MPAVTTNARETGRGADQPQPGDHVFICPTAGIHGHGCWWARVVSVLPALVEGAVYLRVVPADDDQAPVRVFFARTATLLIRRQP